jgi:hypothetical protein
MTRKLDLALALFWLFVSVALCLGQDPNTTIEQNSTLPWSQSTSIEFELKKTAESGIRV